MTAASVSLSNGRSIVADTSRSNTRNRSRALVLVVEDDLSVQRLIARRLKEIDVDVLTAGTAADAFMLAGERFPDLVMVDLRLPDGSGLGLVQQLRAAGDVPIVVVTANSDERSLVDCLEAGADDYITKPFRPNELIARVRAALRRRPRLAAPERITAGSLEISLADRRVQRHGQELRLTPTEYRLLLQLAMEPNKVFTHGALLTAIWGQEYGDEPHVLRVTMNRLRAKLGEPQLLENRPAVGYVLVPDQHQTSHEESHPPA
jgi:two-component system KDP operon response regulator KdpE